MRKLKLQMQISFDGFVTIEEGAKNFNWDEEVRGFSIDNLKDVDTILLGSNTARDFIPYWNGVANDSRHEDNKVGKLLTDIAKIVFSAKLINSKWENTTVASSNIVEVINDFKKKQGKNMLVYGGASFVSSLVEHNL